MNKKYQRGLFIGLIFWGVYAILLMVRTKYVIKEFGDEINAINQSAQQIFNYFILFESGMCAAYLYKMYEPMAAKNKKKVASLYFGLTVSMRKIANKMLIACLPTSFIYAFLINRKETGYLKTCAIIFLYGFRFVIPYFISAEKKTLLTLYGKKYLVDIIDSMTNILIVLFELLLICMTDISIVHVLLFGSSVCILSGYVYRALAKKVCGNLMEIKVGASFEAEKMTNDILIHQIAGLLNSNIDTVLLSVANIQLVTRYQAYSSIFSYPVQFINKVSELFRAEFGLRLANHDRYLYRDFQRLLSFHMFVAVIAISVFVTNSTYFVKLWIGQEFSVGWQCVGLFALYMIPRMTLNVIYIVRDGKGLYAESKGFSIREAISNLILSIILVKFLGIEGVMFATVVSIYLGVVPGNSRIVFKDIFHKKNQLFLDYLIIVIASIISILVYYFLCGKYYVNTWSKLFASICIQIIIALVFSILLIGMYKSKYLKGKKENE